MDVNGEYPDETIEKVVEKGVYTRRIGDILPDNLVDLDDAVNLLGIVSFLDSCTAIGAAYTAFLNDAMTADYSYTLQDGTTEPIGNVSRILCMRIAFHLQKLQTVTRMDALKRTMLIC